MKTNEGQIITIIKAEQYPILSDDGVNIPSDKRSVKKIEYQVHLVKIDPKPIMNQLESQMIINTDLDIANHLGVNNFGVYLWSDREIKDIGHRIILVNEDTAYIYHKVEQKEAAQ